MGDFVELIEVLDSNGDLTGKILNKDEVHRLGLYHKEVAIILINDKNEILLQRRASTKKIHPNKWAWHGGHVNAFETDIDAIIRETKEELGIILDKDKINLLESLRRDKLPNRQFTSAYYAFCNYDINEFKIQKEELSEVRWFEYSKFKDMIFSEQSDMMFKNNKNTNKIISALDKIIDC